MGELRAPQLVGFYLVQADGSIFQTEAVYRYDTMTVSSLSPTHASVMSDLSITVLGEHFDFDDQHICRFNSSSLTIASILTSSVLSCPSLPTSAGRMTVEVSSNMVDFVTLSDFVLIDRPPAVVSILPSTCSHSTLDSVVITVVGERFPLSSDYKCLFGAVAEIEATQISDSEVVCHVPKDLRPGNHSVSVSMSNARTTLSQAIFEVSQAFTLLGLQPTTSSASGVAVSLIGTGFNADYPPLISFGGILSGNSGVVSSSLVVCSVPLIRPGPVPISIIMSGVAMKSEF